MSSVKYYLLKHGCNTKCFNHFKVKLMYKALKATLAPSKAKCLLTFPQFNNVLSKAATFGTSKHVLRLAFLLGFAGFLRRSNLAPESERAFDVTRHTTFGDLSISGGNLVVHLKWSKTLQNSLGATIVLPVLTGSPFNPVKVFRKYCKYAPFLQCSSPALVFPQGNLVTAPVLAKILAQLAGDGAVTLHTLRRSGTSQAFLGGATATQLAVHGTWVSSTFQRYIISSNTMLSPVQLAFDKQSLV